MASAIERGRTSPSISVASLSGKNSLSINELACIMLDKQPTVIKLVGRMAEAGWVKRVDAPHDKRQSLVSLSATG